MQFKIELNSIQNQKIMSNKQFKQTIKTIEYEKQNFKNIDNHAVTKYKQQKILFRALFHDGQPQLWKFTKVKMLLNQRI